MTAQETYNKYNSEQHIQNSPIKYFDVITRFGKFPVIVEERDEYGNAIKVKPAFNEDGTVNEDSEMAEMIISIVIVNDT